jgi:seryl-tRNA synthetase
MALEAGAAEFQFPAHISRKTLEQAGYFECLGTSTAHAVSNGAEASHCLSPATCYHAYPRFAGQQLDKPKVLTCVGKCFRRERDGFESLARLREFTMREVVFLGPVDFVTQQRDQWKEKVRSFAESLELAGRVEVAADPFFGDAARGKKLLQQLKQLKYELRLETYGGQNLAVASFNLHENFFAKRFGFTLPGGVAASSACVAFGVERWVFALLAQRGFDVADEILRR